ncbi:uncharacterized protein LOC124452120 [Xenia sp. Carnegie-2017]|uniref:uncharacterized protein LOC124452120 n=1 Tax=Xenia sp. Carnegie-2017 TaxID=2897299 RepID=UPI001F033AF7|nr:uncharacterized protein LOC124452120 [Xenia sp. Carnegie-2017]
MRYLNGICVDSTNGVYLVRKQLSGTDHPIHCQFKTTNSPSIACSVDTCRQLSETASRSGQANFLCDHVQSTYFIGTSTVVDHLREDSLDYIVNTLKWLKFERRSECLQWQKQANDKNTPLVVQMPVTPDSSNLGNWTVASLCCWHHPPIDDEIGEDLSLPEPEDNAVEDVLLENQNQISLSGSFFYPPSGDVAAKFVEYLFAEKKIPSHLPLTLTVEKEQFAKSYLPVETICFYCKSPLTEPHCVTRNAKLVTMKGIIEGISLFAKFCVECKIPYRYQEYSAGVHNFNDNWLLSLGICDMIRKHLQVHNAVSRTVEAIENWLQLRPFQLPRGQMMNAYLHFEALSDHDYGFSCVLCGHFPPFSELQLPDPESDAPADEVDAEKYWQQVNCGILYRGVLREIKPSYKFWAPYIGPKCRRGRKLFNTEYMKAYHKQNLTSAGATSDECSIEKLMDLFCEGKVPVIREMARSLNVSDKGSKLDIINRIKSVLNIEETFLKLFSKMWGGSAYKKFIKWFPFSGKRFRFNSCLMTYVS